MNWLRKYWIFIVIIVGIGVYLIQDSFHSQPSANHPIEMGAEADTNAPVEIELEQEEMETPDSNKYVDIKGEVVHPGVFIIPDEDARIKDIIELAGGFTEGAATEAVNLAQKVVDEMVIFVPKKGEGIEIVDFQTQQSTKVRVNVASVKEIAELNGIGEVKATAIITYREENGPYEKVDDLLQVTGIGEKTLEKIRQDIQIP
ncbi:helix-hairpin-helix domain-containing protein [Radiobacillus sp. PE A8.2]|uniref:helix-hairpin-helix domain-containing protein n=1 Tax=Radiobacillus sp. PE A8.2 TaxID=3380349 RepID=UPI003890E045